jgi:hypothetical protein
MVRQRFPARAPMHEISTQPDPLRLILSSLVIKIHLVPQHLSGLTFLYASTKQPEIDVTRGAARLFVTTSHIRYYSMLSIGANSRVTRNYLVV